MRTLGKITATLGVVGAIAATSVLPASAFGYGGGCRPGWTVQGGVCKPYHYGPWDYAPHYRHWYR